MTDLAQAFERAQGTPVKLNFGASGLLKDRLAGGEASSIFASANMEHPQALQLTGGPNSPPPPTDRNVCGAVMAAGQADVFITCCTNAAIARREVPTLQVLDVPAAINVAARYGMALMRPAQPQAQAFMADVLGEPGQALLARHGFTRP